MTTEDFEIGQRVAIISKPFYGERGTVTSRDAYTVQVRLDRVTPEMEQFEDSRTGVVEVEPDGLRHVER